MHRIHYWLQRRGSRLMAWLLARDQHAPHRRRWVLIYLFALLWAAALLFDYPDVSSPVAVISQLIGVDPEGWAGFLLTILIRLFHPHTWRHLLVAALAVGVAMAGGARYLDDIFELKNVAIALQYLRDSVFGGTYSSMEIKDGDVTGEGKKTPVYLIGGPGFARVHLGSAALFEQVGGRSIVVGATNRHFLHGFERLREVVDLKNQHRTLPRLEVFTRDGIPVKAIDVQAEFRVFTDQQRRSARNPYPLSRVAVRRLVYGKTVGRRQARKPVSNAWTYAVAGRIGAQVRKYIESHLLDDLIRIADETSQARPEPGSEWASSPTGGDGRGLDGQPPSPANPRRPLSISFYDPEVVRSFQDMGVEVLWVGVGTLETPPEVSRARIAEWQSRWQVEVKGSPAGLHAERNRGRGQQLAVFVTAVGRWARLWIAREKDWKASEVLSIYHQIMELMYEAVSVEDQLPEGVAEVLDKLPEGVAEALAYVKELAGPPVKIIG